MDGVWGIYQLTGYVCEEKRQHNLGWVEYMAATAVGSRIDSIMTYGLSSGVQVTAAGVACAARGQEWSAEPVLPAMEGSVCDEACGGSKDIASLTSLGRGVSESSEPVEWDTNESTRSVCCGWMSMPAASTIPCRGDAKALVREIGAVDGGRRREVGVRVGCTVRETKCHSSGRGRDGEKVEVLR